MADLSALDEVMGKGTADRLMDRFGGRDERMSMEAKAKKNVTTDVKDLCRGDVVMAVRHIRAAGDVRPGTLGVVFEETNAYGDGGGPMVRFMNMCCCNVYHGDVVQVDAGKKNLDIIDTETGEVKGTL